MNVIANVIVPTVMLLDNKTALATAKITRIVNASLRVMVVSTGSTEITSKVIAMRSFKDYQMAMALLLTRMVGTMTTTAAAEKRILPVLAIVAETRPAPTDVILRYRKIENDVELEIETETIEIPNVE
ncbi:hypothetical protein ACHAXA_001185 [Cyclostephanos tholiformis]|uniref:Uncharacterized protein n=1 Tax=Cyclostephanos tholiformis TaxID=382380 RepID=A0ABD3RC77_9STRA